LGVSVRVSSSKPAVFRVTQDNYLIFELPVEIDDQLYHPTEPLSLPTDQEMSDDPIDVKPEVSEASESESTSPST